MNPAKYNHLGICLSCILTQLQRVTNKISYILNFTQLVVMGEDNGIPFLLQLLNILT